MTPASGEHEHVRAISAAARYKRPLAVALGLTATYTVVEVAVGVATGSLALMSDAGHMLTDVAGLGMALAAIQVAESRRSAAATFGLYRLEVLAALVNTLLLFGIATYVLAEAWQRFRDPADIPGGWLIVVAAVGLVVNVVSFLLLRRGAEESLNLRGAALEVRSDLLGSIGVLAAGVVLLMIGWPYVDPIVAWRSDSSSCLPRAYQLGRESLHVLLEMAPADVDLEGVRGRLATIDGVADVHDLHVWTLTSGMRAATAHLVLGTGVDSGAVLKRARIVLRAEIGIEHITFQLEPYGFEHEPELV